MNFDALDFFQNQKSQERNASRLLEEARSSLENSRSLLANTELLLSEKRKSALEGRRNLEMLLSKTALPAAEKTRLLHNQVDMIEDMESQLCEKVAHVKEALSKLQDQEQENLLVEEDYCEDALNETQKVLSMLERYFTKRENHLARASELSEKCVFLKNEATLWAERVRSSNQSILDQKNKVCEKQMQLFGIEQDAEKAKEQNEQDRLTRLHAARNKLQDRLNDLETQREEVCNGLMLEVQTLENSLNQAKALLAEKANEKQKLSEAIAALCEREVDEVKRDEEFCQSAVEKLNDEREKVRALRDGKCFDELWEERRKLEEAEFLTIHTKTIHPKREELSTLKKMLRDLDEANSKAKELFSADMLELENDLSAVFTVHAV